MNPVRMVGSLWTRRPKVRCTEPLAPGFRWPTVPGESPPGPPDDHWWPAVWPAHGLTGSSCSRETLLISGDRVGRAGPVQPGAVALHVLYHAGQQAAPAGPAHGLRSAATRRIP